MSPGAKYNGSASRGMHPTPSATHLKSYYTGCSWLEVPYLFYKRHAWCSEPNCVNNKQGPQEPLETVGPEVSFSTVATASRVPLCLLTFLSFGPHQLLCSAAEPSVLASLCQL